MSTLQLCSSAVWITLAMALKSTKKGGNWQRRRNMKANYSITRQLIILVWSRKTKKKTSSSRPSRERLMQWSSLRKSSSWRLLQDKWRRLRSAFVLFVHGLIEIGKVSRELRRRMEKFRWREIIMFAVETNLFRIENCRDCRARWFQDPTTDSTAGADSPRSRASSFAVGAWRIRTTR